MTASLSICVFYWGDSDLYACADVALRASSYLYRPVCGHSRLQKLQQLAGSWWFYSPAGHSLLHNWTAPRRQCCTWTHIIKRRGVNGYGNVVIFSTPKCISVFVQIGIVCSWMHLKFCVCMFLCIQMMYLKSLPWRFPFSGSPGSGQELDACLTPPSFTTQRDRQVESQGQMGYNEAQMRLFHALRILRLSMWCKLWSQSRSTEMLHCTLTWL